LTRELTVLSADEVKTFNNALHIYAAKMMNGGMDQPRALTPWITVVHSRLPG
jgi:hypothetical protein